MSKSFGRTDDNYKWWALSCTSLGMLLATLNSGTLVIALPDLERALGIGLLSLVWVILAFMIASTVLVLTFGRLSDLFGRKRAFIAGFVVFTLASLGAGFASGGTDLLVWRIVQGIGGALLFANATPLVTDAFPREQLGVAMGTNVMIAGVGLVLGPVLGGGLVEISWHWVFWFNVPLGILGAVWAAKVLRELVPAQSDPVFDWWGTVTFVLGLTCLTFAVSRGGLESWGEPLTLVPLLASFVLLPAFVAIEKRFAHPMLDLSLFDDRGFSAATGAAFLSGLSRFSLTFVFVLYFQGAQGDDPVLAGVKLAPLALGMLIASPLAGRHADRHGARTLAALGLLVTAVGIAGMTTLQVDSSYWLPASWLLIAGVGSGMFNSPNTAAMMGAVPAHRRGVAGATRMMLQNAGSVLSVAVLLAIVTSGVDKATLLSIFSGLTDRVDPATLDPFIHNLHIAMWVLAASSLLAMGVSLLRPREQAGDRAARARRGESGGRVSAMRIGEVARRTQTTVRTLRYYEELGLLPAGGEREPGAHRLYTEDDVARIEELLRLKQVLGVSLEELRGLIADEEARAAVRAEFRDTGTPPARREELLDDAAAILQRQQGLLDRQREQLDALAAELAERRARIARRRAELLAPAG